LALPGIGEVSEDQLRLRLENMSRSEIEPRLPKMDFKLFPSESRAAPCSNLDSIQNLAERHLANTDYAAICGSPPSGEQCGNPSHIRQ
jgi:hypothetical protein